MNNIVLTLKALKIHQVIRSVRIFYNFRSLLTAVFFCALFLAGCGTANVNILQQTERMEDYPRTVAVLPFTLAPDNDEDEMPHQIFRKVFSAISVIWVMTICLWS